MAKSPGRPMKYKSLLLALHDEEVYTPSTIASFAEEIGLITTEDQSQRRLERQRIRITMGRFSNNHNFPDIGDGHITLPGQSPTPGWFGWRWKSAVKR